MTNKTEKKDKPKRVKITLSMTEEVVKEMKYRAVDDNTEISEINERALRTYYKTNPRKPVELAF